MKPAPSCIWESPRKEEMLSGISARGKVQLDICIDSQRLLYLLNRRLLLAEDFRCLDLRSKQRVKRLLLRSLNQGRGS